MGCGSGGILPTVTAPIVTRARDGKFWFNSLGGASVVDPRRLSQNELPPPVHIEQVTADGRVHWQNLSGDRSAKVALPPSVRDLQIDFTALSLAVPEKVRFRYRLEGQDPQWKEVVNDRRVQYSNLAPGDYRFRVAAANESGRWNEAGAALALFVAPAYYQTTLVSRALRDRRPSRSRRAVPAPRPAA